MHRIGALLGTAAMVVGIALIALAVLFHFTVDPIMRIPFVVAAGVGGLMILTFGIELVVRARRTESTDERFRRRMRTP